jgi:hypothetical protein
VWLLKRYLPHYGASDIEPEVAAELSKWYNELPPTKIRLRSRGQVLSFSTGSNWSAAAWFRSTGGRMPYRPTPTLRAAGRSRLASRGNRELAVTGSGHRRDAQLAFGAHKVSLGYVG